MVPGVCVCICKCKYIYIYKHTEIYICLFTDIKLTSVVHAPKKYTRTALGMFEMSVKGLYLHPETQKKPNGEIDSKRDTFFFRGRSGRSNFFIFKQLILLPM